MPKLADVVRKHNLATPEQLAAAEDAARKGPMHLALALVETGALADGKYAEALAKASGAPVADFGTLAPTAELAKLLPEPLARKIHAVPLKVAGAVLHVAMANPADDGELEQLSFRSGKTVKAAAGGPKAIAEAWKKVYSGKPAPTAVATISELDSMLGAALDDVKVLDAAKEDDKAPVGLQVGGDEPPIIKLVNGILLKAIQTRASDIHLEPSEDGLRVRTRIDGVMHLQMQLPVSARTSVVSRLKIMSHLNIAERRLPQDGRIKIQLGDGAAVDFRVSSLPGIYGEKIVIRILGQGSLKKSVDEVGFREKSLEYVRDATRPDS